MIAMMYNFFVYFSHVFLIHEIKKVRNIITWSKVQSSNLGTVSEFITLIDFLFGQVVLSCSFN